MADIIVIFGALLVLSVLVALGSSFIPGLRSANLPPGQFPDHFLHLAMLPPCLTVYRTTMSSNHWQFAPAAHNWRASQVTNNNDPAKPTAKADQVQIHTMGS